MAAVFRPFVQRRTYRELGYLLAGGVFSAVWFGLLLAGWIVVGVSGITPLFVPAFVAFRALCRMAVRVEAETLRGLLGDEVHIAWRAPLRGGFWSLIRGAAGDSWFWRQQAYLLARVVGGFGTAVAAVSAVGSGLLFLTAPVSYRWSDTSFGSWHVDTLPRSLLLVPAGVAVLVLTANLIHPTARLWAWLARTLLDEPEGVEGPAPLPALSVPARRALAAHAALFALVNAVLIVIWAVTTRAYFWPEWTLMPLGTVLAVHGWVVWTISGRGRRIAGAAALTIYAGLAAALFLFFVGIWAVTTRGYFWPMWPLIGLALVAGVWLVVALTGRDRAALTERIGQLETSRAGAVDVSESSLQQIERNLHDGAQARLVSLGMSLGMAEQKLATDPDAARELVAEARAGLGEALRELRDLARGIRPPILADRGLDAAVATLAATSPLDVQVLTSVDVRPAAAVETAAYFVVAEALANASKHAAARRVMIRIVREQTRLTVEVTDDGRGGADPAGAGLSGLRRRVEALDGTLTLTSPPGGPTTIQAVLPCGS
jgi:signal transduction histidine kinase